jgi:threonine/homoserine/homoserine lactone efflux protein
MAVDFPILLVFWAGFGLAVMSPGPNFAMLLGTAARDGRAPALRCAAGMATGEIVWGFAAVWGVAALAAAHPWAMAALRWGGGTFLLYLGVQCWRAAWRGEGAEEWSESARPPFLTPRGRDFTRGLTVMVLNGKAGAFWVALAGVLVTADAGRATVVAAVLGATLISLVWHGALAVALSAEAVTRLYRRIQRGFDAVLGTVLAGLGVRLLTTP